MGTITWDTRPGQASLHRQNEGVGPCLPFSMPSPTRSRYLGSLGYPTATILKTMADGCKASSHNCKASPACWELHCCGGADKLIMPSGKHSGLTDTLWSNHNLLSLSSSLVWWQPVSCQSCSLPRLAKTIPRLDVLACHEGIHKKSSMKWLLTAVDRTASAHAASAGDHILARTSGMLDSPSLFLQQLSQQGLPAEQCSSSVNIRNMCLP